MSNSKPQSKWKKLHVLKDPNYRPKVLKWGGTSFEFEDSVDQRREERRLLVLYTGGTIGMKTNASGVYEPEPNFLVPELRRLPLFHDAQYHAHRKSMGMTLVSCSTANKQSCIGIKSDVSTTSVPRHVEIQNRQSSIVSDLDETRPLAMPISKFGIRVLYSVLEYEPLLDSANMTVDDYARLAMDLKDNYESYDGFVILHGTDTMGYTASALSFMFEDLGKPVILTGSQIPIFEARSDGRDNFMGALIMAGHYLIPEVMVYFHNKLLRGNRTCKVGATSFNAFDSPNLAPLAELEIGIKVHWDSVVRASGNANFKVHLEMNQFVGVFRLFPSVTTETVEAFFSPPMMGVVLQSYGAGNGPDAREDLLNVFRKATKRGALIINTTQCITGAVSTSYATGKALLDAGVIPGSDMTPEGALMKLSYVLGKSEWDHETKVAKLSENLRGEMTVMLKEEQKRVEISIIERLADSMKLSSEGEMNTLRVAVFPFLLCAAAKEGSLSSIKKLQAGGANLRSRNADGRTALHVASCEGHTELVKYLLDNGSVLHEKDRYGHTALEDAVRFDRHEVIRILRKRGASLTDSPQKISLRISFAVQMSNKENLESMYLAGANMDSVNLDRRSALHLAVVLKYEVMVQLLVEYGADPYLEDIYGVSPVDEARKFKDRKLMALLTTEEQ